MRRRRLEFIINHKTWANVRVWEKLAVLWLLWRKGARLRKSALSPPGTVYLIDRSSLHFEKAEYPKGSWVPETDALTKMTIMGEVMLRERAKRDAATFRIPYDA